jgi:hypothetical protein
LLRREATPTRQKHEKNSFHPSWIDCIGVRLFGAEDHASPAYRISGAIQSAPHCVIEIVMQKSKPPLYNRGAF